MGKLSTPIRRVWADHVMMDQVSADTRYNKHVWGRIHQPLIYSFMHSFTQSVTHSCDKYPSDSSSVESFILILESCDSMVKSTQSSGGGMLAKGRRQVMSPLCHLLLFIFQPSALIMLMDEVWASILVCGVWVIADTFTWAAC